MIKVLLTGRCSVPYKTHGILCYFNKKITKLGVIKIMPGIESAWKNIKTFNKIKFDLLDCFNEFMECNFPSAFRNSFYAQKKT